MEKWRKQIGKMPWNDQVRINAIIALLVAHDFSGLDRKQLKGRENIFRVRVGNYRIIYHDDGKVITIIEIPRKSDVTYNF